MFRLESFPAEEMQRNVISGRPLLKAPRTGGLCLSQRNPNFPNLLVEFLEAPGLSADRPSAHEEEADQGMDRACFIVLLGLLWRAER